MKMLSSFIPKKQTRLLALSVILTSSAFIAQAQYTLTDADVVVTGGVIQSCSYGYTIKDIIIPGTLDGQTVTGIAAVYPGVFQDKGITNVQLPGSLVIIGRNAFYGNSLVNIIIPNGVTSIDFDTFRENSLQTVTIPVTVTSIGSAAFNSNAITSVNGAASNGIFYQRKTDGSDDLTTIVSYGGTAKVINFIPGTVTTIYNSAFNHNSITSVIIPNSVVTIGSYAFATNSLSSVTFETNGSVTTIGNGAFSSNSLATFTIPGSVISIGYGAFMYNHLTSVNFEGNCSIVTIGNEAFANNEVSLAITLPSPVLPPDFINWVDNLGTTYNGGDVVTDFSLSYTAQFPYTLTDDDVVVTDGIIVSCSYDFSANFITIPDYLDGQSVIGIEANVFNNKGIAGLNLPGTLQTIGNGAFSSNSITNLIIPDGVTTIGHEAFAFNFITSITIPGSVISLGNGVFNGNSVTEVNSEASNGIFYARNPNGTEDITHIVSYGGISKVIDFIPDTVNTIGDGAFAQVHITSLILPDKIETIGIGAFWNNSLQELIIPGSVVTIGENSFITNFLTDVSFEANSSISVIEENAFTNNSGLSGIILPEPVREGSNFIHWEGSDDLDYNAGDTITDFTLSYTALFEMIPIYDVTFNISANSTPVSGATVTFNSSDYLSNAGGTVIIPGIEAGIYNYTITAQGYEDVNDSVTVIDADISKNVNMVPISVSFIRSTNDIGIDLYPNPCNDFVFITLSTHADVSILNLEGKVLISTRIQPGIPMPVNISNLEGGIYIIKAQTAEKTGIMKIIVL